MDQKSHKFTKWTLGRKREAEKDSWSYIKY